MRDATPSATIDAAIDGLGARIATRTSAGGFGWTLPDLHGNVAGMLSPSGGAVTDAFRYDAYGKLVGSVTSSLPTPGRFQGKLLESTVGNSDLYDFESRSYAPDLGVFTQLDSVAGSAMNPLTLNRYLYADANPETLSDPDGHVARLMDGGSVRSAGAPALSHDDSWSLASSETLARSFALARQVAAQTDDWEQRAWRRAKTAPAAPARSGSVLAHVPIESYPYIALVSHLPKGEASYPGKGDTLGWALYGLFDSTLGLPSKLFSDPIGLAKGLVGTAAFVGRAGLAYWAGDWRAIKEQGDAVVSAWANASGDQKAYMLGALLGGVLLGKGLGALGAGAEAAEASGASRPASALSDLSGERNLAIHSVDVARFSAWASRIEGAGRLETLKTAFPGLFHDGAYRAGSTAGKAPGFGFYDGTNLDNAFGNSETLTLYRGIFGPEIPANRPMTSPSGITYAATDPAQAAHYGENGKVYQFDVTKSKIAELGPGSVSTLARPQFPGSYELIFKGQAAEDYLNSLLRVVREPYELRPPVPPDAPNINPIDPWP